MATTAGPNIAGERFGTLVALDIAGRSTKGHILWRCKCDCGKEHVASGSHLRAGNCRSCGCQKGVKIGNARRTHGWSQKGPGEYKIWCGIIARCENPKTPAFGDYGGRGIRVCARWRADFAAFLADVGPRPTPRHTIDRIDFNGNYEPGNVRWANWHQQAQNRRDVRLFTYKGETACLADWARRLGLSYYRVYHRVVRLGLPVDEVFLDHACREERAA